MRIRRAQIEDAGAIAAQMKVVADEGRWIATESDATVEGLAERFRAAIGDGHVVLVAEAEGRIVASLGLHPTHARDVLSLGMWVLAEHRGQGWGRRLLEAAVEEARAQGARKLELEVFSDNGRAIALYATAGFEVEGLRRDHYRRLDGSLRSALIMARFLQDGPRQASTMTSKPP